MNKSHWFGLLMLSIITLTFAKTGMWTANIMRGVTIKVAAVTTTPDSINLTILKKSMMGLELSGTLSKLTGTQVNFPPVDVKFVVDDKLIIARMSSIGYMVVAHGETIIQVLDDSNFVAFDNVLSYFETNLI